MRVAAAFLSIVALASSSPFQDCSDEHSVGPFGAPEFNSEVSDGTTFYSVLPTATSTKVPLVVFMHGSTGQWEIKLTLTMHPGICGPFGPPPCPACWRMENMADIALTRPLIMTTTTNDNAFRSVPGTTEAEYSCFTGAMGTPDANGCDATEESKFPIGFVQFNQAVCMEDGNRKPLVDDQGHDCITKNLADGTAPEMKLAIKAVKLFGQLGGDKNSNCYNCTSRSTARVGSRLATRRIFST